MDTKFKIGDKIVTNPELDKDFRYAIWWGNNKNKIMTIKTIIDNKSILVHENIFGWRCSWMLKVENDFFSKVENDFFSEEEFEI